MKIITWFQWILVRFNATYSIYQSWKKWKWGWKLCQGEMAKIQVALTMWRGIKKPLSQKKSKFSKFAIWEGSKNFHFYQRGVKIVVTSFWIRPPPYYWVINDQPLISLAYLKWRTFSSTFSTFLIIMKFYQQVCSVTRSRLAKFRDYIIPIDGVMTSHRYCFETL